MRAELRGVHMSSLPCEVARETVEEEDTAVPLGLLTVGVCSLKIDREGGREGGREVGRAEGRKRGSRMEEEREGGREGGRKEGRREGGREEAR